MKYPFEENPLENLLNNYIYFAKEINVFRNDVENYEREIEFLKDDYGKRLEGIVQKGEFHSKKLAENNIRLKEDNSRLDETITQLTLENEDLIKRNSILTKSKKALNDDLEVAASDLERLKIENEELSAKLENKSLKNYLKRLLRNQ